MVYSFKARFVPLIQSGKKLTTIRAPRKDGKLPKPGEVLHLFTGMRTKQCQKIAEVICLRVQPIFIWQPGYVPGRASGAMVGLSFNITSARLNGIAVKDGFESWQDMICFFSTVHTLPFTGYLIEWAEPEPATAYFGVLALPG